MSFIDDLPPEVLERVWALTWAGAVSGNCERHCEPV